MASTEANWWLRWTFWTGGSRSFREKAKCDPDFFHPYLFHLVLHCTTIMNICFALTVLECLLLLLFCQTYRPPCCAGPRMRFKTKHICSAIQQEAYLSCFKALRNNILVLRLLSSTSSSHSMILFSPLPNLDSRKQQKDVVEQEQLRQKDGRIRL